MPACAGAVGAAEAYVLRRPDKRLAAPVWWSASTQGILAGESAGQGSEVLVQGEGSRDASPSSRGPRGTDAEG